MCFDLGDATSMSQQIAIRAARIGLIFFETLLRLRRRRIAVEYRWDFKEYTQRTSCS